MGAVASTPRGDTNPQEHGDYLLGVLVGEKAYDVHSNLWDRLLGLPLTLRWTDLVIQEACESIAQNSIFTGHLSKLLLHLSWSLQDMSCAAPTAEMPILKATNAVRFSSAFLKPLIENESSDRLIACVSLCLTEKEAKATGLMKGNQNVVGFLISAMFSFIGNLDVNPSTYWLHLEVRNLLLLMFSTQLRLSSPFGSKDGQLFLDAAMAQDLSLVRLVVRKLLMSYIARLPLPPNAAYYVTFPKSNQQGMLQKVGSAAASVLKLPYYTYNYLLSPNGAAEPSPLAQNSLLLLLILLHYCKHIHIDEVVHKEHDGKGEDAVPKMVDVEPNVLNPFAQALSSTRDTEFDLVDLGSNTRMDSEMRIPFAALYDTLGLCLKDESSVLLLYSLVHGNPAFLEYVLVRTDIDTLLMPLMEMLYSAPVKSPKQIYMLLIILLILSQDSSFNASIHKMIIPAVSWYKERLLNQTSLGSLMVVILIRTVKFNLSKLRDVYLHTNCLAILSNMAPHVHRLNAYAAQRIVSLFDMLSRKYMKLTDSHVKSPDVKVSMERMEEAGDVTTDLHVYTDFLRIVLEIINAILTYALPRNPEVVYALLHQQELFEPYKNHPQFYELIENLYTVLDFFNSRMDAQRNDEEWSVEKVLQVVIANTRSWRGEGMKIFTQLRFTYEEEVHPDEFFLPYVWQLVVSNSGIAWNNDTKMLFSSRTAPELDRLDTFSDKSLDIPATPTAV